MMEGSVDASWTCGCGSLNAHWRTTCGGCEEREIMENKTPRKDLLKILNTIKEDFTMLQDGSWSLQYSDGTEIDASLDNVDKAIEIVNKDLYGK
tara:strand:- start:447 stop:728 length:282 start_codon:yes stop_codon:yes gene_type:complete